MSSYFSSSRQEEEGKVEKTNDLKKKAKLSVYVSEKKRVRVFVEK